jgi:hypothetical protein
MVRLTEEFALVTNAAMMEDFDTPFMTNSKDVGSIELSRLPTSKAAFKLERMLAKYLVTVAKTIELVPQTHKSILELARDLDDNLMFYAQQIYWLGVVYVNTFTETRPKMTKRDLDNVDALQKKISQSIWGRIDKFFVRETVIKDEAIADQLSAILKSESMPKALKPIFKPKKHKPLNLDKQFPGLATVLSTSALNFATIDKSRQILEGIAKGELITQNRSLTKFASADAIDDLAQQLADRPGVFQSLNWVIWVTAEDDRVCPQCNGLKGETWLLTDPTMIIPVRDTHDNCRCRLLLLDPIFDEQNRNEFNVFAA